MPGDISKLETFSRFSFNNPRQMPDHFCPSNCPYGIYLTLSGDFDKSGEWMVLLLVGSISLYILVD